MEINETLFGSKKVYFSIFEYMIIQHFGNRIINAHHFEMLLKRSNFFFFFFFFFIFTIMNFFFCLRPSDSSLCAVAFKEWHQERRIFLFIVDYPVSAKSTSTEASEAHVRFRRQTTFCVNILKNGKFIWTIMKASPEVFQCCPFTFIYLIEMSSSIYQ